MTARRLRFETGRGPGAVAPRVHALVLSQPFRAAVYGNLALFAMALVWFVPFYETNDDAGMNLICAGAGFYDVPDEHLLFTNVTIGLVLKGLYQALPQVAWYGWYQVAALLLAAIAATFCFLRAAPSSRQVVLALLYVGAVILPCLLSIQFTKTAFLLALAGQLLFVSNLIHSQRRTRSMDAIALSFVAGGAAIRFHSALLAVLMSLPSVVCAVVVVGPALAWRRAGGFAAAVVLVCAGLYQFNLAYYRSSPEWRDFYSYNSLRAEFTDYNRVNYTPATKPVFDKVGWSENDLAMLKRFFYADPERYSELKLKTVLSNLPTGEREHRSLGELFRQIVSFGHLRIVVGTCVCALMILPRWRPLAAVPFATAILACSASVFMYYHYDRLPQRVCMPMFSAVLASVCQCAAFWPVAQPTARRGWLRIGAIVMAAAIVGRWLHERSALDSHLLTRQRQVAVVLEEMAPRDDQLFVIWGGAFPYEGLVRPLDPVTALRNFKCLGLGVGLRTAMSSGRMREFGVEDIHRAIYERSDVFLVSDEPLNALLERYVEEHYNATIVFRPVCRYFGQLVAVKVFQAERAAESPSKEAARHGG